MRILICACAAIALSACQSVPRESPRATAQLQPTDANKATGEATFEQVGQKVRVTVYMQGLTPGREHGLHIHEVGDCGNDAKNAQGHFNPFGKPHGPPSSSERHAGDLPSLAANEQGRAKVQAEVDLISLTPGPGNIVGRALVVHSGRDDFTSQPAGDSGARVACGVIRAG